ncbi:MAG: caspase family protein [Bacteroidia bacterium]|nr:caspase family protein [Bacteroidia bacterium]
MGINKPFGHGLSFNNCVSDAKAFTQKMIRDNSHQSDSTLPISGYSVDSLYIFELYQEEATLQAIIKAFQNVAKQARPKDCFVFYLAGLTYEISSGQNVIFPYSEGEVDIDDPKQDEMLTLEDLSRLMNQIASKRQLVISESGPGGAFANNLIATLFESNPLNAATAQRNRVIVTTKGIGLDNHFCNMKPLNHGPLLTYILDNANPLGALFSTNRYELDLIRAELKCPVGNRKYTHIYVESDYTRFLANTVSSSRGGKSKKLSTVKTGSSSLGPKTYGLLIGNNRYQHTSAWSNLKNPINDAQSIEQLLRLKYKVETQLLTNTTADSFIIALNGLIERIRPQDKLIVFIAGHGYHDSKTNASALVMKDSRPLNQDLRLTSYIEMATLKNKLDLMETKNVFVIFDVCFGVNFDANANDVVLVNYQKRLSDIGLDEFENRKNEGMTRMFLSSGRYEVPDYWNTSSNHSPFASKLIAALEKEDHFITPGKLFMAAEENVTKPDLKYFGRHHTHSDFVLRVPQP